jgi:hypothetical protein
LAGSEGFSAGAVACGDFAGPETGFSGTHPVSSSGAPASASMTTLGAIFNSLNKPMQKCLGTLRLGCTMKDRVPSGFLATSFSLIVLPGALQCE